MLQRAVDVFWEHGYDATSVALLSQAMGISTPSLYSAFGDKRTLFLETLDRYLRTFGAFPVRALAEEPTAHGAITRLLHEAAVAYTRPDHPRGCLLITAATNCTPQSEDIKTQLRDLRKAGANALSRRSQLQSAPANCRPTPTPVRWRPSTQRLSRACRPRRAMAQPVTS